MDTYEKKYNEAIKRALAWFKKQGEKDEEILILKDQIESLHAAIKAIKETHRIELEKQGEQILANSTKTCKDEQKSAEWSEEDERNLYYWLDNNKSIGNDKYRWLLSLKDRVQPLPKQEWSEEDDIHFDRILKELENQRQRPLNSPYLDKIESDYNWLKSLKDRIQPKQEWSEEDCLSDWLKSLKERYTWKPSEEQINALEYYIYSNSPTATITKGTIFGNMMVKLLEQLKKLKG